MEPKLNQKPSQRKAFRGGTFIQAKNAGSFFGASNQPIQKKEAGIEEGQKESISEGNIQLKSAGAGIDDNNPYNSNAPIVDLGQANPVQQQTDTSHSPNKMPAAIQAKMEQSFGADFSDVNIHQNSSKAKDMGALAYAQGTDLHFAPGQFKTDEPGQKLLGHELTHVLQQKQGRVKATKQMKGGTAINDDPALEREADIMGEKAARGEQVQMKVSGSNSSSMISQLAMSHNPIIQHFKVIQRSGEGTGAEQEEQTEEQNNSLRSMAEELHGAVNGSDTDEASILRVLGTLSGRDQAMDLKKQFQRLYSNSLLNWLRTHLNNKHLTQCLISLYNWPNLHGTILQSFQLRQARENILGFSGANLDTFMNLVDQQTSDAARAYLYKALAAGNNLSAIETFSGQIRGKDNQWLNEHLRLTGSRTTRTNTHNNNEQIPAGLQQQWNDSCTPTSALTIRGEMDPIYALSVHEANPNLYGQTPTNGTDVNSNIANRQETMLESRGGDAHPRGTAGHGNRIQDIDEAWTGNQGLNYQYRQIPSQTSMDEAITQINRSLSEGIPVPMRVGGTGSGGHATTIIRRSGSNYQVHDPWAGGLVTVSETDLRNGTFNIAGWNRMTHIGIRSN